MELEVSLWGAVITISLLGARIHLGVSAGRDACTDTSRLPFLREGIPDKYKTIDTWDNPDPNSYLINSDTCTFHLPACATACSTLCSNLFGSGASTCCPFVLIHDVYLKEVLTA